MERIARVHQPDVPGPGREVDLDPEETHHLTRVLRLGPGDAISVFDGRGGEWEAVILSARAGAARVRIGRELAGSVEAGLEVILFQGLSRSEKMEWAIQKGTEIGVAEVRPFAAIRSQTATPSPARLARWRRVALEACKQSGRRRIPRVADPVPSLPTPPSGVLALLPDPGAPPLRSRLGGVRAETVWVAVGPEGGFTPDEVGAAVSTGWVRCGLGPRVLRTETAGMIACALVLSAWGDLG